MRTICSRFLMALTIAAALAVLSGCGGGGGGGGGTSGGGGGGQGGGPSTTLLTLQSGDAWNYKVTGTATAPGQATSIVTGTVKRSIQPATTFNGQSVLSIQEITSYQISGGGLNASGGGTTVTYFTQDPNTHNVSEVGQVTDDGATTQTVESGDTNTVIIPGTWADGDTTSSTIDYTDGSSLTQVFTIGSSQSIAVPAGNYNVWNASVTVDGGTPSTQAWDPAIGSYVSRTEIETADVNGTTWTITITAQLNQAPTL